MAFNFNLLSRNKNGKYALLWCAGNNLKSLKSNDVADTDISQLCDSLMSIVSSASPPPLYICAHLIHGACIILSRQCSETLQHFENEFNFVNNLDIPVPEKRPLPLLEAKDMAIRSGILEISEVQDSFEETLKDSLEEAIKDPLDKALKDSLIETSLLRVQELSLPLKKYSTPLQKSTIDEQLEGSSIRHQDLRQMDEIEEAAALQIEFPQELEIPLEEAMHVDTFDKQELPQKLLLVESSSSDDHSKHKVEQTVRSIITEADFEEQISLEQVSPEGGRRRRQAIIKTDTVTEIRIKRQNANMETRCKYFADDMIAVAAAAHPYMLINSWILDDLISKEPGIREIKKRKSASSLRDLLMRHAEESRTSLQQDSILRTDVGKTKRSETLPRISFEEPSVIPTIAPVEPEMLPDPQLNIDLQAVPYAQEPEIELLAVPYTQEPEIELQAVPYAQEPEIELQAVPYAQEPEIELQAVPYAQEPEIELQAVPYAQETETELQAVPYAQEPENLMEIEDGVLVVVHEEESCFDEDNALEMLKQRILNLWENLDIVTFENLCPRDKTGKREIVRNLRLLGTKDDQKGGWVMKP